MEFTLNVNLNLSEATERTLNRLADAFGKNTDLGNVQVLAQKTHFEKMAEIEMEKINEAAHRLQKEETEMEAEAAKKEIVEAPKAARTRKPSAPKVEEAPKEEPKTEVVEKGTGDFVPDVVAIRALAIPLAKAGHGVKEKLTELGYGGIGQMSEGGNEEHIKAFYAWLLEENKTLK